jgi:hypothetical protein
MDHLVVVVTARGNRLDAEVERRVAGMMRERGL